MKKLLTDAIETFFKDTISKDMKRMGFDEPRITFWGYDENAPYPEDNPTLHGWATANNYEGEVEIDLIADRIWYNGDCGILCYL